MKAFLSPYFSKIEVFGYIRNPQSAFPSLIQQNIKDRFLSFDDAKENAFVNITRLSQVIPLYASFFGEKNLTLRPFVHEQLLNEDVVQDFLFSIGFKAHQDLKMDMSTENESLGLYTALLSAEANKATNTSENRSLYNRANQEILKILESIEQPPFKFENLFTHTEAKEVEAMLDIAYPYFNTDYRFSFSSEALLEVNPSIQDIPVSYYALLTNALIGALRKSLVSNNIFRESRQDLDSATLFTLYQKRGLSKQFKLRNRIISMFLKKHKRFDSAYYYATYTDVAKSGMPALKHYICHGAYEGFLPSKDFKMDLFLKNHPEAVNNAKNPLFFK